MKMKRRTAKSDRQALERIQTAMSGKEWDADTLDEVREVMVEAGYEIKDVEG